MNVKIKEDLDYIMECLNGADGGISFCRLKFFLEDLESIEGTPGEEYVRNTFHKFARIIRTANGEI